MVLPADVRFGHASGDDQSFDAGCSADSIALGPAALLLPA